MFAYCISSEQSAAPLWGRNWRWCAFKNNNLRNRDTFPADLRGHLHLRPVLLLLDDRHFTERLKVSRPCFYWHWEFNLTRESALCFIVALQLRWKETSTFLFNTSPINTYCCCKKASVLTVPHLSLLVVRWERNFISPFTARLFFLTMLHWDDVSICISHC